MNRFVTCVDARTRCPLRLRALLACVVAGVSVVVPNPDLLAQQDGGILEPPEPDSGIIRRSDIHGNCAEICSPKDANHKQWYRLFVVG